MTFIAEKREAFIIQCAKRAILKYEPGILAITGGLGKTMAQATLAGVLQDIRSMYATNEGIRKNLRLPFAVLALHTEGAGFIFWVKTVIKSLRRALFNTSISKTTILLINNSNKS